MPYTPYSIFGLKMKHILSPGYSSYIAAALLLILLPDLHEHLTSGTSSSFQRILVNANRVIEMSDRILDIYPTDSRSFLIKFYAPWCHHCQELGNVQFISISGIFFRYFLVNSNSLKFVVLLICKLIKVYYYLQNETTCLALHKNKIQN